MSGTESMEIGEFSATHGVNDEDVQNEIQTIWDALRTDPRLEELAKEAGIAPDVVKQAKVAPFKATRPEAQFGVAETILISVAGGVLTHVAKNGLDLLWQRVIWPRLEKRFGADLEPKGDALSG
jgi:hypothetical protein